MIIKQSLKSLDWDLIDDTMAKKKQNESDEQEISSSEVAQNGVKVIDPSHLQPQAETDGPPPRPKAVDQAHAKPQE